MRQSEVKVEMLKYVKETQIGGHLLKDFTKDTIYKATPVKMTGKVINHWIISDSGEKILLSANARRDNFEKVY